MKILVTAVLLMMFVHLGCAGEDTATLEQVVDDAVSSLDTTEDTVVPSSDVVEDTADASAPLANADGVSDE